MPDKVFIDTNVLIYGYSEDEPDKRQRAIDCVRSGEAWISTQVLNETINVMNYPAASGRGIRIKIDSIVDFGVAAGILGFSLLGMVR